jgi:hypothetical protein
MVRERLLLPDNERILKIEQEAKAYALRIVGVAAWDTWPPLDERIGEAAHECPEVEAQIEREYQAHIANPANWTPGLLPREHPAYHDCYRLFKKLEMRLHLLTESTMRNWPMGSMAEAFETLTKLTATLPRCGVEDIEPLLDMTHELGEWMKNVFPRDLPLVRR